MNNAHSIDVGFELRGLNPSGPVGRQLGMRPGEWHPLWRYTCLVSPDILDATDRNEGHRHVGHVISAEKACRMADRLRDISLPERWRSMPSAAIGRTPPSENWPSALSRGPSKLGVSLRIPSMRSLWLCC
jgi:hypothetical protein